MLSAVGIFSTQLKGKAMRKRIITPVQSQKTSPDRDWLNLEELAEVEISSENDAYPIESALLPDKGNHGWRAAEPGKQTIRLIFDKPQRLQRIWLKFEETNVERTQEYVLRCSADKGHNFQEVLRQQWNFNPQGATSETEDHHIGLEGVTVLELTIIPDISGGNVLASLAQLRLV